MRKAELNTKSSMNNEKRTLNIEQYKYATLVTLLNCSLFIVPYSLRRKSHICWPPYSWPPDHLLL